MTALHRGEIDIMVNVPPRFVQNAEKIKGYHIVKRPSLRLIYLGLDVGRDKTPGIASSPPNPLKDPRVRQAIMAAIDNRLIVKTIMGGNAAPADQLFPEGVVGYDPSIKLARPDPERAKRLLAEAGYAKGFTVRLDGPNDRYVNDAGILQAVAAQLARVGITVQVNALPKSRFFAEDEQGNNTFFLIGWADTNGDGAGTFDHLLHTPDAVHGYGEANTSTHYSNPAVDRLDEQASREFDPVRRAALLQQANRLVMQDLPHIPLHYQLDIYAVSDRVQWSPRRDTQVRGVDVRWAEGK
jgi:peptide/nickel transport system substrate-binding protein